MYKDLYTKENFKNASFRSAGFCEYCGEPIKKLRFKVIAGELLAVCELCKKTRLQPGLDKSLCSGMWDKTGRLIVSF